MEEKQEYNIVVEHVCMDFKMEKERSDSLKERIIRGLQGSHEYSILHALKDISFQVSPGEVLGIVGSNGSGKSTLLRIIAGALKPSSGRVAADRKKIQLLTLGTGFDRELTAKENVYLNGSLIGYSRKFLDEHYEQIVAFAELNGFMNEKIKNFSSGMTARLGFAIATAGDFKDILILDEVLSVGDGAFRKKSERKMKEIIGGGATTILVSHSLPQIKSMCTKILWLHKGRQIEFGSDVKGICDKYKAMLDGKLKLDDKVETRA